MDQLIAKYEWLVDVTIRKYLPGKAYDEDYHQIGLIALWEALKKYKEYKEGTTAKFESYACKIIRNRIFDEMRRENAQKRNGANDIPLEQPISNDDKVIYIQDVVKNKEDNHVVDLKNFVKELNEGERKVVYLKSQGHSNEQIAGIIHISQYEVKRRIHSAKEKLRNNVL